MSIWIERGACSSIDRSVGAPSLTYAKVDLVIVTGQLSLERPFIMDGMADKDLREVARFLARTSAIKYLEIFYLQVKDDFVEKLVNFLTDFNETEIY